MGICWFKRERLDEYQYTSSTNQKTGTNNNSKIKTLQDTNSKKDTIFSKLKSTEVIEIENILSSPSISQKEKLHKFLLILKSVTDDEDGRLNDETSIKECNERFIELFENYYSKIIETFNKNRAGFRPLIKLMQIFELMLENFKREGESKNKSHEEILTKRMKLFFERFAESDWRFLRKYHDHTDNLNIKKMLVNEDPVQGFLKEMEKCKRALIWKTGSNTFSLVEKIINNLYFLHNEKQDIFKNCLMTGRFDKGLGLDPKFSMIVGDEGGLYLLLNSVEPSSKEESIIFDAGITSEFLEDKRTIKPNEISHQLILGKGAFGKVRFALSIFGDLNVDIGQLVCVKKSLMIGENKSPRQNTLANITESLFEDFFSRNINESVHVPKQLDMSIISNKRVSEMHRKGYLFMEIVPENTADKIFRETKYWKWEYQKPYIIDILKTMSSLLINDKVFNSDLKPQNTLFDPFSRKMAIIDLGSSIFIDKNANILKFDASTENFGVTYPYCPPELTDETQNEELNLLKSLSYLCGVTIAEIMSVLPQNKKEKYDISKWLICENTDLEGESRKKLIDIIMCLIEKDSKKRMDIEEALDRIKKIGSDEYVLKAVQEQYVEKAKILIAKDLSVLKLNEDIQNIRKKGIIKQFLVKKNPTSSKFQAFKSINDEFDEYFNQEHENLFVLLGEAGSGKSLFLQTRFLEELEAWKFGKPLPIFFNMADEINLEKVFRNINSNIGCNLKLDTQNEAIHLYIDSYDEGIGETQKQMQSASSLIEEYMQCLKNWKIIKMVISCRTDFIKNQGQDDLSYFRFNNNKFDGTEGIRARYIVPIDMAIDFDEFNFDEEGRKKISEKVLSYKSGKDEEKTLYYRKLVDDNSDEEIYLRKFAEDGLFDMNEVEQKEGIVDEAFKNKAEEAKENKHIEEFIMKKEENLINQEFSNNLDDFNSDEEGHNKISEILPGYVNDEYYRDSDDGADEDRYGTKFAEDDLLNNSEGEFQRGTADTAFENKAMKEKIENQNIVEFIMKKDEKELKEYLKNQEFWKANDYIFSKLVSEWLIREEKKVDADEIVQNIKRHGFQERMKTGLMFSMIMKILLNTKEVISYNNKLLGFEIYKRVIRQEFKANWKNLMKERKCEKIKILKEDFVSLLTNDKVNQNKVKSSKENSDRGLIFESLEIFGEMIAASLMINQKNRLSFSELEVLATKAKLPSSGKGMKLESKTLYQICKLMGLKLEWRKNSKIENSEPDYLYSEEDLDIGFRHETYKNFYLLRGMKRIFSNQGQESFNENIVNAVLNNGAAIKNYELLKFFGEELQFRDKLLEKGLMAILRQEQEKRRKQKQNQKPQGVIKNSNEKGETRRAVVAMSLLIAGGYNFAGHDLSYLDLQGAYLRGGVFKGAIFEETNLSQANLRHADLNDAKFIAADLQGIQLEVLPQFPIRSDKAKQEYCSGFKNVCFSPDGKYIAAETENCFVKIWKLENNESLPELKGQMGIHSQSDSLVLIHFSPISSTIATQKSELSLALWNYITGEFIKELNQDKLLLCFCFSPDGKIILVGLIDGTLKIWNVANGNCIQTLNAHTKAVYSVCVNPDGKTFATGSEDKTAKIFNLATFECLQTLDEDKFMVISVCFSPDGKLLATGYCDGMFVKIWDFLNRKCLYTIKESISGIRRILFSPNGKTIAVCFKNSKEAKIWDFSTGDCIQVLIHSEKIKCMSFSPDGKTIATGSSDQLVKIWETQTNDERAKIIKEHGSNIMNICFNSEGNLIASASFDQTVRIWDFSTGECLQILKGHINYVISACFTPDIRKSIIASASMDNTVKIWDYYTGDCILTLREHMADVNSVNFNPDGKSIVSGSNDKSIKIWDSLSGKCIKTLLGHTGEVHSVCFNPKGRLVASGGLYYEVKIWDVVSGECIMDLGDSSYDTFLLAFSVCFSPDGRRIACGSCGSDESQSSINIWDSKNEDLITNLYGYEFVCYSTVGNMMAAKSKIIGKVDIFDSLSYKKLQTISVDKNEVISNRKVGGNVCFSPDGKKLATSNGLKIVIWDKNTKDNCVTFTLNREIKGESSFSCNNSEFRNCFIGENTKTILEQFGGSIK